MGAVREATGGAFLDVLFHPGCLRCAREPAMELGSLLPDDARTLASALRRARTRES